MAVDVDVDVDVDVTAQLAALETMTVGQLKAKYEEVFNEPARSGNKQWLFKRTAWGIQARAFGGISERARQRALEIANEADLRLKAPKNFVFATATKPASAPKPADDARLPKPGTVLTRTYKKQKVSVEVLRDGFLYEGKTYPSLSAVAKVVTGSHWNGFLFFGLQKQGGQ
ncbi:hypothetical protein Pan44_39900 [Caulifigura coniformis]|uniref:DUF2924 domain-containing protein n=1 Tax=Caulifigura coniformis TaxID=2527983 RepID=A0A517SIJ3_9PLAN|nr:DUF2924 domain-containing protein [Caulifigura coniformis]QDT55942.1 hypothetical protein Pan44_39900 [Caulifigura coniformis]